MKIKCWFVRVKLELRRLLKFILLLPSLFSRLRHRVVANKYYRERKLDANFMERRRLLAQQSHSRHRSSSREYARVYYMMHKREENYKDRLAYDLHREERRAEARERYRRKRGILISVN